MTAVDQVRCAFNRCGKLLLDKEAFRKHFTLYHQEVKELFDTPFYNT